MTDGHDNCTGLHLRSDKSHSEGLRQETSYCSPDIGNVDSEMNGNRLMSTATCTGTVKGNPQESIMSPYATQLIVPHALIARHPQRVRQLALLLYGEEEVALNAQNQRRDVFERCQAFGQGREVRRGWREAEVSGSRVIERGIHWM